MPNVGVWEIGALLLVLLLLFGPKRLPELGRMVGRGVREFRDTAGVADLKEAVGEIPRDLNALTAAPGDERPDAPAEKEEARAAP